MTDFDFHQIDYLKKGTAVQQRGYEALVHAQLFETLKPFHPVLTGTLPLDLFVDSSDLDISCEVYDEKGFEAVLQDNYGNAEAFSIRKKSIKTIPSIICSFRSDGFLFEIFGQALPVEKQMAYLHMLAEYRILQTHDEQFKNEIIRLKKAGIKTEEAFAMVLGLSGDPYEALLTFTG